MRVHLPIVPPTTTSQMKRVRMIRNKQGKSVPMFFKSKKLEQAEADYISLLEPYAPPVPIGDPVKLSVTFVWPHLAGTSRKRLDERIPKQTRPDCDNLVKQLADVLVKLQFIRDDGQIACLVLEKFHGPAAGVTLELESLVPPTASLPL